MTSEGMAQPQRYPRLVQTVIDTTDVRALAEFYRQLLGYAYRPGDAPPAKDPGGGDGADDGARDKEWLVLRDRDGSNRLAFQQVERLERTTWPDPSVPMQMHLDCAVPDVAELERQRGVAEGLGAELVLDRRDDPEEPLYVFTDPSGHPFCIFVA